MIVSRLLAIHWTLSVKNWGASKSWRNAAINAQDIKGSSVISAMHHSLVLDKAHLVFSPCQTVLIYTHFVFMGFINRIDAFLGNGQCRVT